MQYKIGDIVRFGSPNGQQTKAKVVKVNHKTIKVKTLEARGKGSVGAVWNVHKTMAKKVGKLTKKDKQAMANSKFADGLRASFNSYLKNPGDVDYYNELASLLEAFSTKNGL